MKKYREKHINKYKNNQESQKHLLEFIEFIKTTFKVEALSLAGSIYSIPTNWNPIHPSPTSGTVGLVYEPLFHFDPLEGEHIPWLASEGKWINNNIYRIELREGLKWHDGETLTAEDVVFTFELAKNNELHYSSFVNNHLENINISSDRIVEFSFSNSGHQEWNNILYKLPIVPQHTGISGSPYSYWQGVASDQINKEVVTEGNFGRYENEVLFDLIEEFNSIPDNDNRRYEVAEDIQKILLKEMPSIPLWHGGAWAVMSEENWTAWPADNNTKGYPIIQNGGWQMGMTQMLLGLESVN